MKNITLIALLFTSMISFGQSPFVVTNSVSPLTFEETTSITITINGNSFNETTAGIVGNALYLWSWSFDVNNAPGSILDCPTNGSWTNSNEANRLTYNSGSDTYSITFTPNVFYNRPGGAPIGRIGFLVKAKDGTGDKKSQDTLLDVGLFQVNLTSPNVNSSTIITSGGSLSIAANSTNGNSDYNLYANGVLLNNVNGVASYAYNHTSISSNQTYELQVTQSGVTKIKKFNVIVNPGTVNAAMPSGMIDGINYNSGDVTKATLVLDAPGKDFVYVAGSFNNWQPGTSYSMKKDPASGKFWLELMGLTSGVNNLYQYWVVDTTPIANSPSLVKTADPYSTLVLSPFDDPFIPATTYPNLPLYPAGQDREVTVLQTGQTPYSWINSSFAKPKKEDLIIYEALVRDFDSDRNFQDLIDKISYFKNLKVNAIQLMPVMEFEGNESWGYNTSFHLALDKFYGTSNKFKEFVDLCHTNGIAVILDVALNHAFGRNPMNRMWMNDPDNDGWGDPASDNPYFNTVARHSYSVGSDFNHTSALTKNYVKRVVKHWIEEYKIDGFRWDLTKGFTQNCTSGDDGCTNGEPTDRVPILKDYADYGWSLDPTHYTIFEHLGTDSEEQKWANYRLTGEVDGIPKGIMMWGKMTDNYATLTKGFVDDVKRVGHSSHGFTAKRLVGYAESHDEERVMYKNLTEGNTAGHNARLLNVALSRMKAMGAMHILVPGPKMIWHFGALGWESSIFTCNNGTTNFPTDPAPGDCKLDKKPQPQWVNNWLLDANRFSLYSTWAKMNALKINEPVFEGNYDIIPDVVSPATTGVKQRMYIYDNSLPANSLRNVVVLANFSVAALNVKPDFPYTGTWYNLMDNTSINVTNTATVINIPAGEFRVYGNQLATTLATNDFELAKSITLYPNPANDKFVLSNSASNVEVYNLTGQLVKTFKGNFETSHVFLIDDLNTGIYLVRINDDNKRQTTTKLVKE
ncbi:alpha-amylase family glycosyl hydrolase [Flavobacterium sp.]|uniref:alpha-amylase family glycosyl hydrolase n=1 Tax=Flavobacterium sp. TaxID=239 RepID=UPI00286E5793|nr:alpha-amylase family glycosyl hydrolase [Flavobacterium sp.]